MEMSYATNHENMVEFGDDDTGRYGCLCTFPHNDSVMGKKFGKDTVASLALLGAAIAIDANQGSQGFSDNCYHDDCTWDKRERYLLPDCVPKWIRDEIKKNLDMELDKT